MKRRSSALRAAYSRESVSSARESAPHPSHETEGELARRTLRTVLLLLGACVLFVGLLSVTAVLVTSRAVGAARDTAAQVADPAPGAKKPLSI